MSGLLLNRISDSVSPIQLQQDDSRFETIRFSTYEIEPIEPFTWLYLDNFHSSDGAA
ncbi:hypothetical protein ACTHRH_02425 [Paenibacillus sp. SAFN-117]|uniref:hypothetical protein n=1 Tax=Paenibacillus sp. 32O-W TaxID=1695218 RepID=UPI001C92FC9F|nr:hypothetical protein [Paenibacillus sp. 32O-W]